MSTREAAQESRGRREPGIWMCQAVLLLHLLQHVVAHLKRIAYHPVILVQQKAPGHHAVLHPFSSAMPRHQTTDHTRKVKTRESARLQCHHLEETLVPRWIMLRVVRRIHLRTRLLQKWKNQAHSTNRIKRLKQKVTSVRNKTIFGRLILMIKRSNYTPFLLRRMWVVGITGFKAKQTR